MFINTISSTYIHIDYFVCITLAVVFSLTPIRKLLLGIDRVKVSDIKIMLGIYHVSRKEVTIFRWICRVTLLLNDNCVIAHKK